MRSSFYLLLSTLAMGCGGSGPAPEAENTVPPQDMLPAWRRLELPMVEDNVHHDTLLIQVTFDMGDGSYLMVAGHMDEKPEGLRLLLYRPRADSSAEILASSKPGYDSMTMFPVFYTSGDPADGLVLLANMGEKQSWGQEVFWLKDQHFNHLGFLDLALREWRENEGTRQPFRTSIAPATAVSGARGAFQIAFTGDSVQLYDDLQGNLEKMYPARAVQYRTTARGLVLWIDGKAVVEPAI